MSMDKQRLNDELERLCQAYTGRSKDFEAFAWLVDAMTKAIGGQKEE